jgi:AcrR family transcriptional regulator
MIDTAAAGSPHSDTRAPSHRTAIIDAARELFAVRSYHHVTIRDVAAAVDLSPAMVMKVVGSKEKLFSEAAIFEPEALPVSVPRGEMGTELVRRIVERHGRQGTEPLARGLYLSLTAPDPEEVKNRFRAAYVDQLTELCGGDPSARRRAELIVCALLGLVTGFHFTLASVEAPDQGFVVEHYGALVQSLIDA